MARKVQGYVITGMQRDMATSRPIENLAYENFNIRITAMEDTTLLAVTNEKGNKLMVLKDVVTKDNTSIIGTFLGHCTVGKYLVLFTKSATKDYIFRLELVNDEFLVKTIYEGNLNFSTEHLIDCLGFYENEAVQKVYWVDGLNPVRCINIVSSKTYSNSTAFDFIGEVPLAQSFSVEKILNTSGVFKPGVIQYLYSFYDLYGRESNLIDSSALYYITHSDRGANPEDECHNAFVININNINNSVYKYDKLRIYSIERQTFNGDIIAKVVTDINLTTTDEQNISYTDTGNSSYIIDFNELLLRGGDNIIANTILSKDNTLFLGNFKYQTPLVSESIKQQLQVLDITFEDKLVETLQETSQYYAHKFQLNNNAGDITTYKIGETYRFGIQLQDTKGKWSEVIFIKDKEVVSSIRSVDNKVALIQPTITVPSSLVSLLLQEGYKKIRPVVVYPDVTNRTVLTQGILCPTLYKYNDRKNKSIHSIASWFARPTIPLGIETQESDIINTGKNIYTGSFVEFRHDHKVPDGFDIDRHSEINYRYTIDAGTAALDVNYEWGWKVKYDDYKGYFIDQNIVTLHSPELYFRDLTNIDTLNLKLKIVGFVPLTATVGKTDIVLDTNGIASNSAVDTSYTIGTVDKSEQAYKSLVGGNFFKDTVWRTDITVGEYEDSLSYYLVRPWERNGSLNNNPKASGDTVRSAVLKHKVLSNLKYSYNTEYFKSIEPKYGISKVNIYDSDTTSITKFNIKVDDSIENNLIYMGNIDTILSGYNTSIAGPSFDCSNDSYSYVGSDTKSQTDPISIKFKSSPHAVFSFNSLSKADGEVDTIILPTLNETNQKPYIKKEAIEFPEVEVPLKEITSTDYTLLCNSEFRSYDLYEIVESLPTAQADLIDKYIYSIEDNKVFVVEGDEYSPYIWREMPYNVDYLYRYSGPEGNKYFGYVSIPEGTVIETKYNYTFGYTEEEIEQDGFFNYKSNYGGFWLAELHQEVVNRFGGTSENALMVNDWVIGGNSIYLIQDEDIKVGYQYGDTYYQRFDCLKTLPYTENDLNSVVEIISFMCESRINLDGRYDRNRGLIDNTIINNSNFNLLNNTYNQKDNAFPQQYFDSSKFNLNDYPASCTWSLNKFLGADIDVWTKILATSTLDLDGNYGPLTKLQLFNNDIYGFQHKALSKIAFNSRVQINTSDGTPIEIANSGKVDGYIYISTISGSLNKWSILSAQTGLFYIDNLNEGLYVLAEGIGNLSAKLNMQSLFKEHNSLTVPTSNLNNFKLFYDKKNKDIYFINKDTCFTYNELLGQFVSFYSYENIPLLFNFEDKLISLKCEDDFCSLWESFAGEYNSFYGDTKSFYITFLANPAPTYCKVFDTLEFRAETYNHLNQNISDITFDNISIWNDYQYGSSKLSYIVGRPSNLKKKFRVWRAQLPRHNNTMQRIRDTWSMIKLEHKNPYNYKTILHDMVLYYTV